MTGGSGGQGPSIPPETTKVSDLPPQIQTRLDLEALLARATNFEERRPPPLVKHPFKLGRVRAMFEAIGNPQRDVTTVHIAGSKGKGTVARMTAQILEQAGRGPVGLYTSPHLRDLSERITVDGVPATDAALCAAADRLLPHVRRTLDSPDAPSFFELMTGMAWLVFRDRGCHVVVLETGLGGRLDATNVCEPQACVITMIELEHTDVLGETLEEIAREKAGILKPGVPCATSAHGVALGEIERVAETVRAPLVVAGREIEVLDAVTLPGGRTEARLAFGSTTLEVTLPLAGTHHAANALLAAWCARTLSVEAAEISNALETVRLPAIVEPIAEDPLVVVDGAHTVASAEATRAAIDAAWPDMPIVVLLAMLEGKDATGVIAPLVAGARHVVTTALPTPRSRTAEALADTARLLTRAPVEAHPDRERALRRALAAAGTDALVLVVGSVRIAGWVRTTLSP